ncbi:WecB/TagA/CpsF family glycosyltransferase [Prosthecobacter vanneervenii]|uniref:N-acetylglucosaminyldiphosphoundecaprenol N-acetyl-beta-D-mannosaminyltransferase n=1 Tax=Prosthecobacter vanneervenii TaxID=48466 RepID=A0A7W7YFE0_9BACT|nr:WecB/TagA/CpsF family glycosyltransferase [Prosthecobacter vanneervenii]MBB5035037.1 N-acetylglucosaminyldiphosphoundecaprenol N-acetyl-beta-D-mannosaminyltransferase [Prosthecobacter vanneervenii]
MNPFIPMYGTVLGTRLDVTDYEQALNHVVALARCGGVAAVAAANTHLLAEAAANADFAAVLKSFDVVLPDGMPLVWGLKLDGHDIKERVYGPYFMQHVLRHAPAGLKHYFFGGTKECLKRLEERARELNPQVCIAGAVSPPFGRWDDETETRLIDEINAADADFVWIALGGVKQETWIAQNRHRFKRGVFLAVGDAFALVAGLRSYAPKWMQRCGLTWVYRLSQEPKRLLGRYLIYNTRFVLAFLGERWRRAHS